MTEDHRRYCSSLTVSIPSDLRPLQHGGDQVVAPGGCISHSRFQFRTWKTFGPGSVGFQKSTKPLDATRLRPRDPATDRERAGATSEYSILRIASPAVLPGMFGLDASARSQRTRPVTWYVPLPVTTLLASQVSQFPPPVAALEVPPSPAGATNVPAPVTMILSPSAAVAAAEPKICHPIWAAAVGAPMFAESASAG